jgi:hypothetical protein
VNFEKLLSENLEAIAVETFEAGTEWLGHHALVLPNPLGSTTGYVARLFTASDGYLFRETTIPPNATYMTFDWAVENAGNGEYFTVSFNDDVLYYENLDAMGQLQFNTIPPIFVGDHAGETGTLLFSLHSVSDANASVLLDNVTFSAVPEPSTLALLGVVVIAAIARACGRSAKDTKILRTHRSLE